MPYFKWKGVNYVGKWQYGKVFARTKQELELQLLQQNIALITCRSAHMWLTPRIRTHACAQLFSDLATLCDAGILLPHALEIVGMQLHNPRLQSIVFSIADAIQSGVAPHDAFAQHPSLFDFFMVNMIRVGHRSGAMPRALVLLANHVHETYEFSRKIKTALVSPLCTVVVFLLVSGIIFIHIIPSFASLFMSVGYDIPKLTWVMLTISDWVLSWHAVEVATIFMVIALLAYKWCATECGRYWRDKQLSKMPFVGSLVRFRALSSFFRALSLLLQGGDQVLSGVMIARGAIKNRYIKDQVSSCEIDIQSGKSITHALMACSFGREMVDLLHMVQVGERSGTLAMMVERAAVMCERRAMDRLTMIQSLVQPIMLLSLGLLVALLIFAVYVPLFTLSDVIAVG